MNIEIYESTNLRIRNKKNPDIWTSRFQIPRFQIPRFPDSCVKGFTLFELLVVVSIIGILIGFGAVSYSGAQRRARDARRMEDMREIQSAMELCYSINNGSYPSPGWTTGALVCDGETLMASFPADPKNDGSFVYQSDNLSDTTYCYCAYLESAEGNSGADCASGTGYYCVSQRQ